MISSSASTRVVRSVALFEATKGALVLAAGCGLLTLLHRDVGAIAVDVIGRLHMDPERKYPGIFIEAASRVTDSRLWFMASLAAVYSAFRFLEAYGLWKQRSWAEWLALISGGIYLPVEVYEVIERLTWMRLTALVLNLLIVYFMAQVLWRNAQARAQAQAVAETQELVKARAPQPESH